MSKKIYVGNLSYSLTEEALQQMFARFGAVESARIITDRDTGRSKGFGFVEMTNDQEAADAIGGLNGKVYEGRALSVSEARPQAPREGREGGRGFREGGKGRSGGGGRRW